MTIAVAIAVVTGGCQVRTRPVAPTAQVIKQIGVPAYPNAKPQFGMDTSETVGAGAIHQLSASFVTNDDMARVERFYAARIPREAQRIVIPLGIAKTVSYQWYDKASQKQVMIMALKDRTVIQLRSMTFGSGTPTPAPQGRE